ncbi:unnamed protein product, partial [Ectocarpus fasciculatus]
ASAVSSTSKNKGVGWLRAGADDMSCLVCATAVLYDACEAEREVRSASCLYSIPGPSLFI